MMEEMLAGLAQGVSLTAAQQQNLKAWMLSDPDYAYAFHPLPDRVDETIQAQAQALPLVYPTVFRFWREDCQQKSSPLVPIWWLWLPLALRLIQARKAQKHAYVQGVLGMQGAGKTTLTRILSLILDALGYGCCSLSIDDFYLPYDQRRQLQQQDPRLRWRGPPGTHDLSLAVEVLQQFRGEIDSGNLIQVPRFDKSAEGGQGDRNHFEPMPPCDIVLFEGWFVGAEPIDPEAFDHAPPPICTPEDRQFARDMNRQLAAYLPLWDCLDSLIVLELADYRLSKQWRRAAEHQAMAMGQAGMSDAEIDEFVDYFWRALHPQLFVKPLVKASQGVDLVITINPDHGLGAIYQPHAFT